MDVVVGIDDSPSLEPVLRTALAEAELRGAGLHVAHVVQLPSVWVDGMTVMSGGFVENESEVIDRLRELIWDRVRSIISDDVKWVKVDRTGYPPDELVEYAASIEAALLIVGHRSRGGIKSLLLGSTSHRVSHESPCNVLIVKSFPKP
ncbi:MAG: universal stress protein [Acidimicrobiia bacterium]